MNDIRLRQLDQRLVSGAMTAEEEREYKALQEAQSAERLKAMTMIAKKQVKWRWFNRRR